jgi:chromosome partitioning protein
MAKILVSATNKGGEGKTTLSINLAEYCAIVLKKKVLAIDLDPQANFSGRYIKMEYDPSSKEGKMPPIHNEYDPKIDEGWDGRSSIAEIYYSGKGVFPYTTEICKNLEILPAHSKLLLEAEHVTKSELLERVHLRLKTFVNLSEVQKYYDIIIVDTPPSKAPLTISALKAASHLVMPIKMESFSIQGLYGMLQLWKQETYARSNTDKIELVGILPNQIRDINLHASFLEELKNTPGIGEYIIPHKLKQRAVYTEILAENASPGSVFDLPESHVAREECEKVCEFIMKRVI